MHNRTFAFESDFVETLRCIPMAVRLKLDTCGVKLTLRQWSGLSRKDRQRLLEAPCEPGVEAVRYRDMIRAVLEERDLGPMRSLDPALAVQPPRGEMPEQIMGFAGQMGLGQLSPARWACLDDLQRFALLKLSRDNHDNINFVPALREFGLI